MRRIRILVAISVTTAFWSGCGDISHSASALTCPAGSVFFTQPTTGKEVPINSPTYGGNGVAQSLRLAQSLSIGSVDLELVRLGTPPVSKLTLQIETDSAGVPSGSVLATATYTVAESGFLGLGVNQDLSTTPMTYTFSFSNGSTLTLAAATTYWLVVSADYAASDTDVIKWMANDTNAYTSGQGLYLSSGSYVSTLIGANRDFIFDLAGGC